MSDKKIKCLSRRSVICNECGEKLDRHDYFKQHFERKHPGKPCMARGQSSISNFVSVGSKRKADAVKSSEDNTAHASGYGTHHEMSSTQSKSISSIELPSPTKYILSSISTSSISILSSINIKR